MTSHASNAAAGALFVLIGLFFGGHAYSGLAIGTALNMGPGYFPLVLAAILIVLGLAIAASGLRVPAGTMGAIPWRGATLILLSPIVFGATISRLGLVPALTLTLLLAAFAGREISPLRAVLITAGLVVFCILVFHVGLGSPMRLIAL